MSFVPELAKHNAQRRDESLQADCSEGVPSIPIESELRRESEAVGNQPASIVDVKHLSKTVYGKRNGGGGNCTRVPRSIDDGLYVRTPII